ncbi:MAG: hypothetical protein RBT65_15020 [Methanolobus sp.]|jgi:hypothetical protein|nr:hypothetical protein [Methanolobus sp.]
MKLNKGLKIIGATTILFVLIVFAYFFLVIYNPGSGMYVDASVISEEPNNYVEMTPEELEHYPCVKEAVSNPNTSIKVASEDFDCIEQFQNVTVRSNNTHNIKVNDTYYEISVLSAD